MKICFLSPWAYSLFEPDANLPIGGSEVRAYTFATALSELKEFRVTFITHDCGQPRRQQRGAIELLSNRFFKVGSPLFRTKFWGRTADRVQEMLIRRHSGSTTINGHDFSKAHMLAYNAVNADVYCCFGMARMSAELIWFCRNAGKPSIYFSASDSDFSEDYSERSEGNTAFGVPKNLCHYILTSSDRIVVQTEKQKRLLAESVGREAVIVKNPITLNRNTELPTPASERNSFLWIGKSHSVKQPDILLRLARELPDLSFSVILNPSDEAIFREFVRDKPDNVDLVPYLSFSKLDQKISQSAAVINTSIWEGFSNVFLQAGKYEVPIFSLNVDPDGIFSEADLGFCAAGNFDLLKNGIRNFVSDPAAAMLRAKAMRQYVQENHDVDKQAELLVEILRQRA